MAASKIQKGNNDTEGDPELLNVPEVDYLDISETNSEAEEIFEDERKEAALAAAQVTERENALLDEQDD